MIIGDSVKYNLRNPAPRFELFYQRVGTLPEYTTILSSGCVQYSVSPIRGTNLLLLSKIQTTLKLRNTKKGVYNFSY